VTKETPVTTDPHPHATEPQGGQDGIDPTVAAGHDDSRGFGSAYAGLDGFPVASAEDRTWGLVAHLGALLTLVFTGFLGFLAPLVVLAARGQDSAYARRHAVASLNFQLTLLVVGVTGSVLGVLGAILTLGLGLLVIVPVALAYVVFALVVMIQASLRASQGEEYRYPLSIRFFR
jgi:uncharacterized protein